MRNTLYKDPVCGKRVNRQKAHIALDYEGYTYFLCCPLCQRTFEEDPSKYAREKLGRRISARKRQRNGNQRRR